MCKSVWPSQGLSTEHIDNKNTYHKRLKPIPFHALHGVTHLELAVHLPHYRCPPYVARATKAGPHFVAKWRAQIQMCHVPGPRSRRVWGHCESWPLWVSFFSFSGSSSWSCPAGKLARQFTSVTQHGIEKMYSLGEVQVQCNKQCWRQQRVYSQGQFRKAWKRVFSTFSSQKRQAADAARSKWQRCHGHVHQLPLEVTNSLVDG